MSESWRGSFLCSLHSACASAFAQPPRQTLWPERVQLLGWWAWLSESHWFWHGCNLGRPFASAKEEWRPLSCAGGYAGKSAAPGAAGYHRKPVKPRIFPVLCLFGAFAFCRRGRFAHDIYNAILYVNSPPDCSEICEIDLSLAELVERLLCRCPDKRPQCKDFSGFTFSHGMQWSLLLSRQVVPSHLRWLPLKNFHTAPQLCEFWKGQSETKKVGHLGVENMACPPTSSTRWAQDSSYFCRVKELHL